MFFEIGKSGIDFSLYLFGLDTDLRMSAPMMWILVLSFSALRVSKFIKTKRASKSETFETNENPFDWSNI